MTRVLVTGGTGFVGRHAVADLLGRGYEVHVAARRPDAVAPGAHAHALDLLDTGAAERLVAAIRPERVLHLAWAGAGEVGRSGVNARYATAGRALLAAFAEAGGERAVVAGTCAEYDWRTGRLSEHAPLRPRSPLARAKDELRRALGDLAHEQGISACWARLFFLYGPGDDPLREAGGLAAALAAGRSVRVAGADRRRDYLYVADAGEALAALVAADLTGPVNVGSGHALAVGELASALAAAAGDAALAAPGPPRGRRDEPLVEADVGRLRRATGWLPRVGVDEGAAQAIAALRA